mgnify:FL=1
MSEEQKALYCSCHGTVIMAKWLGDKLVVLKEKHGVQHTLIVQPQDLTLNGPCDIALSQLNKDAR